MVEQSLRMQVSLVSFGVRVPCAGGHVALYTIFSRGERSCHEVQWVERRAGNGQRRESNRQHTVEGKHIE